jgi:hypothetical protein
MLMTTILLLSGCKSTTTSTSSSTTNSTGGTSFTRDIQPIFTDNCVVCHQGSNPPGGLSLEPGKAYGNLVNKPSTESSLMKVAPGSPDKSYLINKLFGTQAQAGGSGAQMPYGGTPLFAAQLSLIQQWISQGAPNN